MQFLINFFLIIFLIIILIIKSTVITDNVIDLIIKSGYPAEEHIVKTNDEYYLTIHRIPLKSNQLNRKVVLLMHGMGHSSIDFLIAGPQKALGFILSDAGYDVWLANARGNTYSRNHQTLKTWQKEFWYFSWHEIGEYDLPAIIDDILRKTNQTALHYVAHSQGTTSFFVMLSLHPEYNKKILSSQLITPSISLKNVGPLLRFLADNFYYVKLTLSTFRIYEFLSFNQTIKFLLSIICQDGSPLQYFCIAATNQIYGSNPSQLNTTLIPLILQHAPAGISYRQFLHYGQMIISGKFRQYDFDTDENFKVYNQSTPPEYNVSVIDTPIILYYGTNDLIVSKEDVWNIIDKLGHNIIDVVKLNGFTHVDFLYGIDAKTMVYNKIISSLIKFS